MSWLSQKPKVLKWKETGILAGSTAIGQIITYLTLPLLGRLFSVEDFNSFSIFYAWIIPLSVIATFKIELAIPHQTNSADRFRVAFIALRSCILFSLCILFLLIGYSIFTQEYDPQLLIIPLGVFSNAVPQILYFLTTRENQYAKSAWYRILNNLFLQFGTAALGFYGWGFWGLTFGFLIGQWVGALILLQGNMQFILKSRCKKNPLDSLKEFRSYLRYSMPQGLLETLQLSGTVALLSILFHDPFPGVFYLCWRVLQAPITMVSNTVFVVQYNQCAQLQSENKDYTFIIKKSAWLMGLVGTSIGIVFLCFGPQLFALFLGEQHQLSGQMAQYLSLWFALQFTFSPFSFVPLLKQKQKESLLINSLDIIFKAIAFIIGYWQQNLWLGLGLYSVGSGIINIGMYRWYLRLIQTN